MLKYTKLLLRLTCPTVCARHVPSTYSRARCTRAARTLAARCSVPASSMGPDSSWGRSALNLGDHDLSPTSQARTAGSEQPGGLPGSHGRERTGRHGGRSAGNQPRPALAGRRPSPPFPSHPSRPHNPALAASAQAPEELRRARAREEPGAEGSALPGVNPRSGVLAPPGVLFINTLRGRR